MMGPFAYERHNYRVRIRVSAILRSVSLVKRENSGLIGLHLIPIHPFILPFPNH